RATTDGTSDRCGPEPHFKENTMRHATIIGALVMAVALTASAHAGWYVEMHGTTDSLSWQGNDGRALDLSSMDGKGIKVVTIMPDGRDGLHKGDLITAVDGHAVGQVVDLVTYANAHMTNPTRLSISRHGHDTDLALAAGKLGALMHPHP
ncbi:MAG: hypothetical protein KGN77_13695, partial [Xanthomonadaceae bacterium]|nr:hypothetical protein [Xanthomonadaceae bacterium]